MVFIICYIYNVAWLFYLTLFLISFLNVVVAVHERPYMEHVSDAVSDRRVSLLPFPFYLFLHQNFYLLTTTLRHHSRSRWQITITIEILLYYLVVSYFPSKKPMFTLFL